MISKRLAAVLLISISAVYVLLIPKQAPSEYILERNWVCSVASESLSPANEQDQLVPFRLGRRFGYTTESGELAHLENIRHGVAFTPVMYANYGNIVQNLVLQEPGGEIVAVLGPTGYPMFVGERLFTISNHGSGLSAWSSEFTRAWQRQFGSLITAVGADAETIAVGLLSGEIVILDDTGVPTAILEPGQSRIPLVYGVDLDKGLLAVISGRDPQLLSLFSRQEAGFIQRVVRRLDSRFARPVFLDIDDGAVFFETESGLGMAVEPEWELQDLPIGGRVLFGGGSAGGHLSAFLAQQEGGAVFALVDRGGSIVLRSEFAAEDVWMNDRNGALYVGIDTAILRFAVTRS
jgi:hypothetical protein